MKENQKQMIFAFLLGVCLPMVFFRLGDRAPEIIVPTAGETAPSAAAPEAEQELLVRVLHGDGAVETMELEGYVLRVVLAEMPADFEMDALKAQAVVARTYTLKRMEDSDHHPGGAVCTDFNCCQAYITEDAYLAYYGAGEHLDRIRQAVTETRGQVLTYEGYLADATYFSCSGGWTEDAAAVWGTEIPYLQSVESPGEENAGPYAAVIYYSAEEFKARLGLDLPGSPPSWLGWATYTQGRGVDTMMICGIPFTGVRLRALLGLPSTAFTMDADEGGITVHTLGKGHRVGMSQYGADAMAVSGSTYDEILAHYYRGTSLGLYEPPDE